MYKSKGKQNISFAFFLIFVNALRFDYLKNKIRTPEKMQNIACNCKCRIYKLLRSFTKKCAIKFVKNPAKNGIFRTQKWHFRPVKVALLTLKSGTFMSQKWHF